MCIRYYIDPETGQPHIYGHGVTEVEVEYVLRHPGEDRPGADNSRHALGQTAAGRSCESSTSPMQRGKVCSS